MNVDMRGLYLLAASDAPDDVVDAAAEQGTRSSIGSSLSASSSQSTRGEPSQLAAMKGLARDDDPGAGHGRDQLLDARPGPRPRQGSTSNASSRFPALNASSTSWSDQR